jgi:hypothetical protein
VHRFLVVRCLQGFDVAQLAKAVHAIEPVGTHTCRPRAVSLLYDTFEGETIGVGRSFMHIRLAFERLSPL